MFRWLSVGAACCVLASAAAAKDLTVDQKELQRKITAAHSQAEIDAISIPDQMLTPDLLDAISIEAEAARRKSQFTTTLLFDDLLFKLAQRLGDVGLECRFSVNASLAHDAVADLPAALELSRQGVKFARQMTGKPDLVSGALLRQCTALRRTGDLASAVDSCKEAIEVAVAASAALPEARAHNGLGLLYRTVGNLRLALDQYEQSLRLAKAAPDQQKGVAYLENNIGEILAAQGNDDAALDYFEQSLKIKRANGSPLDPVSTLDNIATIEEKRGEIQRARKVLEEALAICDKFGNASCRATNLDELGALERDQGHLAQAIVDFRGAVEIGEMTSQPELLADLAEALAANGELESAKSYAEKSVKIAGGLGSRVGEWRGWSALAKISRLQGNLGEAEQALLRAIAVSESMLLDVAGAEDDRQRYLENKLDAYRELVEVLIAEGRTEDSLAAAERARSRVLREVLASGRIEIDKGLTSDERKQETDLRQRMAALNTALNRERLQTPPNATRVTRFEAEISNARAEYSALESALYAKHADLGIQRSVVAPGDPGNLAASIDRHTAVVEYVVAQSAIYAYVIAGGNPAVHLFRLPGTAATAANLAHILARQIASRNLGFGVAARALYQLLLAPAGSILKGKTSLVIVPDGVLWQVPFQALQFGDGRYVVEEFAVSYAPSMTVFEELLHRKRLDAAKEPTLLAAGNPEFPGATPLPAAGAEVARIAELYGAARSRVLTGSSATESIVKMNAGRYDVLHLATHGALDDRHPMYSSVVLSPGPSDDGLLEAWEMMRLNLKEEVVVLSACETGQGVISQGEGLIGLTWALFVAGAPTTVASLWKVDSASTTELMVAFHNGLRQRLSAPKASLARGQTKSQALRAAMLISLRCPATRHPYYWAGFEMLGDGF